MKLAEAKIQYSGGMVIIDRVSIDVQTCEVLVPPRLKDIIAEMDKSETWSTFTVEFGARVLDVTVDATGGFSIKFLDLNATLPSVDFRSLASPSKDQRRQNGRFLHMLSAASFVGAALSSISTSDWNAVAIARTASLTMSALLLGAVGLYCIKED